MKSKAMVLYQFNQPMEMRDIEIPVLTKGQVLVRIDIAGICGSDVHQYKGEDPRVPLPIILGHEGVGRIAAMQGERYDVNGEKLHEGDYIIWNRGYTCGSCESCVILKEPSLCKNRKVYGINISSDTPPYLNGCYSEYIILSARTDIFKVREDIEPEVLVTASCSGATTAHGFSMINNCMGKTVLIQGPGPLGFYSIAFAKNLGASKIIMIGGSEKRLELCSEFGATDVINRKKTTTEERRERVMEITGGKGVDLVIEAAGRSGVVEEGIKLARVGGTYLTMGFAQPAGLQSLDFYNEVVKKNLTIKGVWVSDCSHTFMALELCKKEAELFKKLVTHKVSLDEANYGIELMRSKEALKVVIKP